MLRICTPIAKILVPVRSHPRDYTKQNIGDSLRWLGIDTDFGRNPHTVKGANIQSDIPGAEPEQHAQSTKRTLADRNNNPGNIRPVSGKGFRFFESALEGWEAMKNQLMRYFTGKTTGRALQTIQDIVSTWPRQVITTIRKSMHRMLRNGWEYHRMQY
ncbi:hypothetical protein O5175_02065 [Escherichia coli]|nr:hypothetical protein [Escherichia coli]